MCIRDRSEEARRGAAPQPEPGDHPLPRALLRPRAVRSRRLAGAGRSASSEDRAPGIHGSPASRRQAARPAVIVTDTNVVAYLLLGGVHFEAARAIYRRDHEWSAPVLWRSEFANVLAGSMRRGELSVTAAESTYGLAEELVRNREYFVPPSRVLQMVAASPCSAYD